ncbi:MAG: hypothetical protein MUO77_10405 [Anaerolineales bacterium]|nr:hypothetical protein [Anaerolineales bacterium]
MNKRPETTVHKVTVLSRRIAWSGLLCSILGGAIMGVISYLAINYKWLGMFGLLLYALGVLVLIVCWMTPGLLVVLGAPELAHAWLLGGNSILFTNKPWRQLSGDEKFLVYFSALGISSLTVFVIVGSILYIIQK